SGVVRGDGPGQRQARAGADDPGAARQRGAGQLYAPVVQGNGPTFDVQRTPVVQDSLQAGNGRPGRLEKRPFVEEGRIGPPEEVGEHFIALQVEGGPGPILDDGAVAGVDDTGPGP